MALAVARRSAARPLKTSLLSAADIKANPSSCRSWARSRGVVNALGGDFRWQHLPVPFEVYADGIDLVIFEEFGSGAAALHLSDQVERNALLQRRGVPPPVPQGLRREVRPAGVAPRLLRRRDRRVPRRLGGRQDLRPGRRRARRPAPGRRVPRPGRRARHQACAGAPRSPTTVPRCSSKLGARPRRPDGLLRRRRAPAQHGVLQLRPAPAAPRRATPSRRARRS